MTVPCSAASYFLALLPGYLLMRISSHVLRGRGGAGAAASVAGRLLFSLEKRIHGTWPADSSIRGVHARRTRQRLRKGPLCFQDPGGGADRMGPAARAKAAAATCFGILSRCLAPFPFILIARVGLATKARSSLAMGSPLGAEGSCARMRNLTLEPGKR